MTRERRKRRQKGLFPRTKQSWLAHPTKRRLRGTNAAESGGGGGGEKEHHERMGRGRGKFRAVVWAKRAAEDEEEEAKWQMRLLARFAPWNSFQLRDLFCSPRKCRVDTTGCDCT